VMPESAAYPIHFVHSYHLFDDCHIYLCCQLSNGHHWYTSADLQTDHQELKVYLLTIE